MQKFELTDDARAAATKQAEAMANAKKDEIIIPQNRLMRASDFTKDITAPKWLIKNVIPEEGLLEVFGASGSYKSFIVLDMLFCIASGLKYHGVKVEHGTVIYVSGEGASGVKRRLRALELHYKVTDYDFFVLPMPSNLMEGEETQRLADEIRTVSPDGVAITIFDTLHRNSAGSQENSSDDFAKILGHIDTHLKPLSKVVGWVHHTGLSDDAKKRSRGTSSRYAALDASILIEKSNSRLAVVSCTKQKDAEPFSNVKFELQKVPLGVFDEPEELDDFGTLEAKEIISLVPVMVEGEEPEKSKSKLKKEHHELLNCLRLVISTTGQALSEEIKHRESIIEGRGVSVSEWKAEAMKVITSNGDDDPKKQANAKSKNFTRRKKDLIDEGQIGEFDSVVWINADCKKSFWGGGGAQSSSKEE